MRINLKMLAILIVIVVIGATLQTMVNGTQSVLNTNFSKGIEAACYITYFLLMVGVVVGAAFGIKMLLKSRKKEQITKQGMMCRTCGTQLTNLEGYGWFCEKCRKYE